VEKKADRPQGPRREEYLKILSKAVYSLDCRSCYAEKKAEKEKTGGFEPKLGNKLRKINLYILERRKNSGKSKDEREERLPKGEKDTDRRAPRRQTEPPPPYRARFFTVERVGMESVQ